ncbi:MAG: large extracellular alpha-helical protein, partial [Deltaproteobacteria bacterium]|nr:large extracellular alpha-helical protein [Deltaproteobacteria bacterium]
FKMPLGIRNVFKGKSGAVFGYISTSPHLKKSQYEREFFAQVTPFQVHVKAGHFNTLVWVTDFETGKGVEAAKIIIYKDSIKSLSHRNKVLSKGITDSHGLAMLDGTEKLDPDMRTFGWGTDFNDTRFFVRVDKGQDIAVLPLDEWFLADTYQASNHTMFSRTKERYGHIHAWGTTAQGVYRIGDTIQYKLFVRNQDNKTFITPPKGTYSLEIIDPMGKSAHKVDTIKLSEFGTYHGEFTVPKTSAVGWYQFVLRSDFTKRYTWRPMRVLVSDFTPASFRVETDTNGDLFHQGDSVEVNTTARLHSGGPYIDASARIVARLKGRYFSSKHHIAKSFIFDSYRYQERPTHTIFNKTEMMDDKGRLITRFQIPDKGILYGSLIIESAVQDDRGKYIADSTIADYVGRNRFVGLKNTKWIYKEDEPSQVKFIVVDETGKPKTGSNVKVKVERLVTKASRVKGAGNAYLTKYIEEWVVLSRFKYVSKDEPGLCEFLPSDPGTLRITASIKDTKGREHSTTIRAWVAGKGRVVWHQPDDNSIEIIPEQEKYKIGDAARYLIKNPFPGATALISIERYGVMDHWTQTLNSSTPVIEFPVKPEYLPGFYFSIIVMSPRVDEPLGEGDVDLGKPTFRMGYVSVPVKDPYKEIDIDIKTEKEVYKPRDKVKASLKARLRQKDKEESIELAVVVIDEAVFDLLAQGRDYYDPYKGFYHIDGLDLQNYSLLTRLVGRQKFEKKGANAGGGGGPDIDMRSIFKFVSYWNPSLRPDENGIAKIEFDVPDNLTGWRIFAMAVTPTDRMGLGDTGFKVNKPTEIRPVMPNQVIEGDEFKAGFSVMNRTDKTRKITVEIKTSGPIVNKGPQVTYKKTIKLSPYKRTSVWMPIRTKGDGKLKFEITAGDTFDADGLIHEMPINKRRSLETAANYGTTIEEEVMENILFPKKIHTDVGSVSVVTSPTVIGNVVGAFRYMKNYPYSCWEQKLSKGVMASHYVNLREYLPEEFIWKEGRKIAQQTIDEAINYQAPNGGMTYYKPTNRYVSPYLSAYTAIAFNWLRNSGYKIPAKVEKKLHDYLYSLLKRDILPTFFSKGMSSSVRAVALAALSDQGRIDLSDLDRYQSHVSMMDLFGKAHYLHAALNVKGGQSIAMDAAKKILAHSSQTGGKFIFNETLDDSYKRILATPMRANGAILSAFTKLSETKEGSKLVGDVPFKLVRSITQIRGNRDHWENTQENVFCMNALIEYSRVYEKKNPKMTIKSFIDEKLMGETIFKDLRDDPVTFENPITKKDPGRKANVKIMRLGKGRLYYATRVRFAPLEEHATHTNAGIEIRREYSVERNGKWILLKSPMKIKRGELVRVDIYLSLPTARNFIVVDDPVPGGLEPVNRYLATASDFDADKGDYKASGGSWWFQFSDWIHYNASRWSFYHQELRHDSVRYYSDYLSAGHYHLSYTAQAIAEGEFVEMPVHAEEMYDPDVYGKGITGKLIVSD